MEEIADGDGKPPAIRTTTSSSSTLEQQDKFQPPVSPSPPSSAFVSALQSPYISPRAAIVAALPSPSSLSTSDDVPSTSYTPPPDYFELSDASLNRLHKLAGCIPATATDPAPPRVSFSFQVPRVSFAKSGIPAPSAAGAKLRSCDVYIGYHSHRSSNIARFCRWLKSELELQGIACFIADRAKYGDAQSHETASRIMCSVTFGVVVVSSTSCSNPSTIEEMTFFAQKKNLIPLLFGVDHSDLIQLLDRSSDDDKDWREAIDGLVRSHELLKLETSESSWRSCIGRTVSILKSKLGRKNCDDKEREGEATHEIPFPRNKHFVGRDKELSEMEATLFGSTEADQGSKRSSAAGIEDLLGDDEWETTTIEGKSRLSLEVSKCKEPTLEAWIDPTMDSRKESRSLQKQRSKHKRSRTVGGKGSSGGVFCINGGAGVGKTELALEFAHRFLQRYKMVLWVGGEARYLRQNILNLSINLGLDVSAEAERERGRRRSFEEQEQEAFHRVKRELFRDIPYLLIIDNVESEEEWWEGKDLHNLIPRNTGATHVIITTRLPKVMSFDPLQLPVLSMSDSLSLTKGRRKEDYSDDELAVLKKFDERLSRSSFGASLVGSLLTELLVAPSTLFNAIDRIAVDDKLFSVNRNEEEFCRNNLFLMKTFDFCFAILNQSGGKRNLALRMLLAGAWLAPAPVSATMLAAAAENIPHGGSGLNHWRDCVGKIVRWSCSCVTPPSRKSEAESALLLVRMGLARRVMSKQCCIQLHEITQFVGKARGGLAAAKSTVVGLGRIGNPTTNSEHLWASAFLIFGFKSEPPLIQLKASDMVVFIKKTALPLALKSFTTFSRCNSAFELLKVCTNVLEEIEKSFVSQIQDWGHESLCWKQKLGSPHGVDEYFWQDVTLLKATLLETRAKLLVRGGHFDTGEELCRTCVSIRTVMLGHGHAQTLAAQHTLAKLVRLRTNF